MKIRFFLSAFFFIHFSGVFYAQKNNFKTEISTSNKPYDTIFVTGFYKVNYYFEEKSRNFCVQYTQQVKDIELEQPVFLFKRKVKSHYIHSSGKVIDIDKESREKNIRVLNNLGYEQEYLIYPVPIASKENVMRIYNFKYYNYDSTVCLPGLTVKLNQCNDFDIENFDFNKESTTQIGLIINNQLVAIAKECFNAESYSSKRKDAKYLVFIFNYQSFGQVEAYKRELFNQTLMKQ